MHILGYYRTRDQRGTAGEEKGKGRGRRFVAKKTKEVRTNDLVSVGDRIGWVLHRQPECQRLPNQTGRVREAKEARFTDERMKLSEVSDCPPTNQREFDQLLAYR
jgi:hypothetical protein